MRNHQVMDTVGTCKCAVTSYLGAARSSPILSSTVHGSLNWDEKFRGSASVLSFKAWNEGLGLEELTRRISSSGI
jgi:hypothetical protein